MKYQAFFLNTCPAEPGYTLPLQTVDFEEANWSGSALFAIKYVRTYINNLDQVICLAEN